MVDHNNNDFDWLGMTLGVLAVAGVLTVAGVRCVEGNLDDTDEARERARVARERERERRQENEQLRLASERLMMSARRRLDVIDFSPGGRLVSEMQSLSRDSRRRTLLLDWVEAGHRLDPVQASRVRECFTFCGSLEQRLLRQAQRT